MPYGTKADPTGRPNINFDTIYKKGIEPAIREAGLEPVRADKESMGGIIHKPMFERLLLCEYAVADLTTANANVFYELGVRHAARPRTTQAIFAKHQPIPFDLSSLRAVPYSLGASNQFGAKEANVLRSALLARLTELRNLQGEETPPVDSPIFQLIQDWKPGKIARRKTEVFFEQVREDQKRKERMLAAKDLPSNQAMQELKRIEAEIGDIDLHEIGAIVDLMLCYREFKAWDEMISLYGKMPGELKRQVMVREQLAFALNRRAGLAKRRAADRKRDRNQAIRLLKEVIADQGPSSETNGLLGRIYKDLWLETGLTAHLDKAATIYEAGFEADWRDAYPGINAITMLEVKGDAESLAKRDALTPVVRYSVLRRLEGSEPDYWDYATMLELSVLASDRGQAQHYLGNAVTAVQGKWEAETTARNLNIILLARQERGERNLKWIQQIVAELGKAGVK